MKVFIRVTIEQDTKGFIAKAPGLPGCTTWGQSFEEAQKNIAEVMRMHLEIYAEDGEELPSNKFVIKETDPFYQMIEQANAGHIKDGGKIATPSDSKRPSSISILTSFGDENDVTDGPIKAVETWEPITTPA